MIDLEMHCTQYLDHTCAAKVMSALFGLQGVCLDNNEWEYFSVAVAVCRAIGADVPDEWVEWAKGEDMSEAAYETYGKMDFRL
jgi:hypothetical protein